ncbi:MAG: sigma-70 family RNA polymerase sigma factor [Kiritimatiellae bacterium]|nr:sigma-70 family RNA polymerase sigma factor [Kiritimatiellia bacterium]
MAATVRKEESQDALLEKARRGDFDAFAALCEPCRRKICIYLCSCGLASPDDAEDVFMDSVLRARRSLDLFHGSSSFSTWLTTIARNIALDRRRSAAAHPVLSLDAPPTDRRDDGGTVPEPRLSRDESFPNPAAPPDPAAALDAEARAFIVRSALREVPVKTREALVLFYMQNRSYQEISEILAIPIGTVMSRLHNGRRQLERSLFAHAEDLR